MCWIGGCCVVVLLAACIAPSSEEDIASRTPHPRGRVDVSGRSAPPQRSAIRRTPRPGEVVYFRLNPDPDQVDQYCGAFDRSYVVEPVHIPQGETAVLTHALRALFHEEWAAPRSVLERVTVTDGHAAIFLRSPKRIGFASATCGGNTFLGSVLRTTFQFESVQSAELRLGGSCEKFGEFMQAGLRCLTFTRDHL